MPSDGAPVEAPLPRGDDSASDPADGDAGRSPWPALLKWGARLGLVAGIVYYVAVFAPVGDILAVLASVNVWYLLLAISIAPLGAYATAARQKVMTDRQGMTLTVREIVKIDFVTRFYNLFLPGYVAGGVIRWPRMAKPDGKPVEALASIAFNRSVKMLVAFSMALTFWFLGRPEGLDSLWISLALVFLLGGAILGQLAFFNERVAARVCALLERPRARRVPGAVKDRVAKFARAAGVFQDLPRSAVLRLTVLSIVHGLVSIVSFLFLAWSLHIALSFVAAGWVRSFLKVAGLLPLSFMGVGMREVSVVVLLQIYGVPPADAVALSVLLVGRSLIKSLGGGLVEAWSAFAKKERFGKLSKLPQ